MKKSKPSKIKTLNLNDEPNLNDELPPELTNIIQKYVGDGEIITDDETIPFLFEYLPNYLKQININNSLKSFDINLFTELNITSDYKGLFKKVKSINGDIKLLGDMSNMFYGCKLLVKLGDRCDTKQVTNMSGMFRQATIFNQPLNWNTENVTDMSDMFNDAKNFNQSLDWNTKKVNNMSGMFYGANMFNKKLLNWDTRNVTNMSYMFMEARSFNKRLDWDTRNVINMSGMFMEATSFNKPLLNWDTRKVTNMREMFNNATSFNQPLNWDVENVKDMSDMFDGATSFNQSLNFDTRVYY